MMRSLRSFMFAFPIVLAVTQNANAEPASALPEAADSSVRWTAESSSALALRRGGMELADGSLALAEVSAQVSGNQVGAASETGAVSLSDSAVSGVRGIFVATFNTGNNASVQTNLNVVVRLD